MAKFCSECGTKLYEKDVFCPNCGSIVVKKRKKFPNIIIILVICFIIAMLFLTVFLFLSRRKTPSREYTEQQIEIGDTIEFGTYEQDNDESDGKEPIEWIVLEKEDGCVFLISEYCLEYRAYNTDSEDVTWENSALREWLNDNFIDEAFSSEEKEMIITQTVENPGLYAGVDEDGSWIQIVMNT